MSSRRNDVWRVEAPHVLAALLHRSGDFVACEDAVQDALLAASVQWQRDGMPDNPRGWLIRVASRKLIDQQRRDAARRAREERSANDPAAAVVAAPADAALPSGLDDTIRMLMLCAHPALTVPSQVALSLRVVCGLTTEQVAAAFLVPASTMRRRISRAKAAIARAEHRLPEPGIHDLSSRLGAVRHVLYLTFNEGYTRSSGDRLADVDLATEAIGLTRMLHHNLPSDPETTGLLALMLLTHARVDARVDPGGDLIPLSEQDRGRWRRDLIEQGVGLIESVLGVGPVGPFQLQAAIAAVHDEAPTPGDTDWAQIAILYAMLDRIAPSPTVTLNRAVAIGMADGPDAGLAALAPLLADEFQQRNHRLHSAHAHLLELGGRHEDASAAFHRAAALASSIPEQRYLNRGALRNSQPRAELRHP